MSQLLPIESALPELLAVLSAGGQAVLQAPPGAGKTTRVPLALLETGFIKGRILILEPRRLAARAAAERMAELLGERVGQSVGYRIRGENKTSGETRIEVVTEGILTRMIQSGAELPGVGAVIFDEFHERSLQADLGLALTLELREALRCDLVLLVMSATLDAGPVAELMGGAPVITSEGQSFEVETRWLDRPLTSAERKGKGFEAAVADLVEEALSETEGGVLVFLPGEREIRRVEGLLRKRLRGDISIHMLFGALEFKAQRAAIAPERAGRKIVLATSIAETSLTIEDIRVVVDGGRARRARFDPGAGMSRLVTERVTKAEATQRRGRAGRVAPGVCYRLWSRGEEGGLAAFPPAEIEAADLAPLVLETALWGARDPAELPFLSTPGEGALAGASRLLLSLGVLDDKGAITRHGRKMAPLPLHPRLAHMVLKGGKQAPELAALISERDIISGEQSRPPADFELRLKALANPKGFEAQYPHSVNRAALTRVKAEVRRLRSMVGQRHELGVGATLALAYPDRIGLRRNGPAPRYVLSGGKGAFLDDGEALGESRMIVACDLDGDRKEARIRLAAALDEAETRVLFADQIEPREICEWSQRERAVLALKQERFGALVLQQEVWRNCPETLIARAMCDGLRLLGFEALELDQAARLLIARVEWLRARGALMPDFSAGGLMDGLEDWLGPFLGSCRNLRDLGKIDLRTALVQHLGWDRAHDLDRLAPAAITAPTGTRLAVDYATDQPRISVRLQEMFGLSEHPTIGPERTPLLIELLSPARRPVQTTADLPGFWQTSYADVRKDMRGRYPKHPWPEDPAVAVATRRVKPRKG